MNLSKTLKKQGFSCIPLKTLPTQHLLINAKINGKKGRFILDTGASLSCIGKGYLDAFSIKSKRKSIKAVGAGSEHIETTLSKKSELKIKGSKSMVMSLIVMDISHINEAMESVGVKPIHGIVGADVLEKKHALIDYAEKKVYLKK